LIRSALDCIGDHLAYHRGELEAVTAPTGRDDESFPIGVPIDEKISVESVTVQAYPRSDDGCVGKPGDRFREEGTGTCDVIFSDLAATVGPDLRAPSVVPELHPSVVERREPVPAGSSDVCSERRKAGASVLVGIIYAEVKYRLRHRLQDFPEPWKQDGRPGACADDDRTGRDLIATSGTHAPDA